MLQIDRRLLIASQKAERILKEAGIPFQQPKEIVISSRMSKALGKCCRSQYDPTIFTIKIAQSVLQYGNERSLLQVMLHEYIHTCEGCFNHGKLWKWYAMLTTRVCGIEISRTADLDAIDMSAYKDKLEVKKKSKAKYKIICQKCGHTVLREKRSKAVMHPESYRCPECRGKLSVKVL